MQYKISAEAVNDLAKIWLYTVETWSIEQADYYYNLLMDEIEYIAAHPKAGKDYNEIRKGYFRTRVKFHFIFYKIDLTGSQVEIIRILHQQMDVQSRLED